MSGNVRRGSPAPEGLGGGTAPAGALGQRCEDAFRTLFFVPEWAVAAMDPQSQQTTLGGRVSRRGSRRS